MRAGVVAIVAASGVAAAFLAGRLSAPPKPASDAAGSPAEVGASSRPGTPGPGVASLAELTANLESERRERERLEAALASLSARVDELAQASGEAAAEDAGDEVARADAGRARPAPDPELEARWSDDKLLRAVGLRPADAEALRDLYEEVELSRLYLRDTALREGWPPQRLRRELRALDDRMRGVRDEWGDGVYDWFLYASGSTNRVVVESVIGSSPAEEAGIRTGDTILTYDGRRVFSPAALRMMTNAGELGETVVVEVLRGGSVSRFDLPRGPIGIRLDAVSQPPRG